LCGVTGRPVVPEITASQLPPVICSHCKRRGHVATQCTAGEVQEFDDFKGNPSPSSFMSLLCAVVRVRVCVCGGRLTGRFSLCVAQTRL
jgi:hypothetical protein